MKTGTHFKLFCLSTVTTLAIGVGLAASNAVRHGDLPADLRGEVVNFAVKTDRLNTATLAQSVARSAKNDRTQIPPALFAGTEPARGGVLDQVASSVTTEQQVVNRFDKADVDSGALFAQVVVRGSKTDPASMTVAASTSSRNGAAGFDAGTLKRVATNRAGKADSLSGALLAQNAKSGRKTHTANMIVASLAPAKPAIQPTAQRGRTEIVTAALQKPLVFVPVTVLYDRSAANLADPAPRDPVTKVLWE